jgi:DNA polymerase I
LDALSLYRRVWAVDFEFTVPPGERPAPLCVVARELRTGERVRLWLADGAPAHPPYGTGPDELFIAYYASAELGCHLALGWPMPARVLDLYAEFRCLTSGRTVPCGKGLLGALAYFGLDGIGTIEKEEMRQLAMRGGAYTDPERLALLDYCQTDVVALTRLLPAMLPRIDLPRALLRGRYMAAAARMEWTGVPIDTGTLARLRTGWEGIQEALIARIDAGRGIYEGRSFRADRFAAYLASRNIPWPMLPSGALALDDDTFREMARSHPEEIGPLRELRHALGQLRLNDLAVGPDGRNRLLLSAFQSRTGRNQPSNSRFIFGPATWLRSLIKPEPGRAVAYVDWSQQELGIAAALSGDRNMQQAYQSGDFYLTFAKMAGAVPCGATKRTHAAQREQFKTVALGVLYGLSAEGLARKLHVPPCRGWELLRMHQETFRQFWRWSDQVEMAGMLTCRLRTVFGWTVHVGADANPRSLRNFPMQANGAEMLRLACCLATERGIMVCAPVHDALLVEGLADGIEDVVAETKRAMREASEVVLPSFPLRTEAKTVRWPDRYVDERGRRTWETVLSLLDEPAQARGEVSPAIPKGYHG